MDARVGGGGDLLQESNKTIWAAIWAVQRRRKPLLNDYSILIIIITYQDQIGHERADSRLTPASERCDQRARTGEE